MNIRVLACMRKTSTHEITRAERRLPTFEHKDSVKDETRT
jgi:hypothetical protein